MNTEFMAMVTQFGAAGLIGMLWLAERRAAAIRDRELSEAHQQVVGKQREIDALLNVVKENTRAIAALEQTQRTLIDAVRQWHEDHRADSSRAAQR